MTKEFHLSVDRKGQRKTRYIFKMFALFFIFPSFNECLHTRPGFLFQ